jgi:ABC-type transport system involved in multi-copper enzyme maturation permease subunit
MRYPGRTPFAAIFQNEVLLNSKRIAPYVMAILCGGNALLWWGWGPAGGRGWATNSEFLIAGMLPVYSFMTLPLFTAVIMGDPVIRDFRAGIDPLIFSQPVTRAEYLLGKFFGNFFVLVLCQAAFVLTLFVLQGFRRPGMVVVDVKVFPYFKHFLVFVVISHLVLAAFYFTVGTLTRNTRIVYGLGVCFYPLYIAWQTVILNGLPTRWRITLDPLLMNWGKVHSRVESAEWLNQLVIAYDRDLIANRAFMILIAGLCLAILYVRFTIAERPGKIEAFSLLNLSAGAGGFYYDPPSVQPTEAELDSHNTVLLPNVTRESDIVRASLKKLIAALGVEFRLLRSERSLVVIMPLALFLSTLELAFWKVTPEVSYSGAYASNAARSMLIFLIGITIFYTGEAMHRDRDLRIEPILWSLPISNRILLLSKFLSVLMLGYLLMALVGLCSIALQIFKHETPIEIAAYVKVYAVILVPSIVFLTATALALNVLLRERYLTYFVSIGACAGLFYLYGQGYRQWSYNPLLYQLWTYAELTNTQSRILWYRLYWLVIASVCILLAHVFFERKTGRRFRN